MTQYDPDKIKVGDKFIYENSHADDLRHENVVSVMEVHDTYIIVSMTIYPDRSSRYSRKAPGEWIRQYGYVYHPIKIKKRRIV
jgi:hypothetical protein